MNRDSVMLNNLGKTYMTNFLNHLGADAGFNARQKKHVQRQIKSGLGFNDAQAKKLSWFVQTQINGWNCQNPVLFSKGASAFCESE